MATSSPPPNNSGNSQSSFKIDKLSALVWRRVFLIRYFKILGGETITKINWKDFDKNSKILTLNDEKKAFEWKLPHSELAKSSVEIIIDRKKLCVINIFYNTQTLFVQGKNSKKWLDLEYIHLKSVVSKIVQEKGSNSTKEIDQIIRDVKISPEICYCQNLSLTDDSLLEQVKQLEKQDSEAKSKRPTSVAKKKPTVKNDILCESNVDKQININNPLLERIMEELVMVKESMHKIERNLAQKDEHLAKVVSVCEKIQKRCEKIPELQKDVQHLKESINKIKVSENSSVGLLKETTSIKTQIVENKNSIVNKYNENMELMADHIARAKEEIIKSVKNVQSEEVICAQEIIRLIKSVNQKKSLFLYRTNPKLQIIPLRDKMHIIIL